MTGKFLNSVLPLETPDIMHLHICTLLLAWACVENCAKTANKNVNK